MSAEHVVSARVHTGEAHAEAAPDGYGAMQLGPHVTIDLRTDRHGGDSDTRALRPQVVRM